MQNLRKRVMGAIITILLLSVALPAAAQDRSSTASQADNVVFLPMVNAFPADTVGLSDATSAEFASAAVSAADVLELEAADVDEADLSDVSSEISGEDAVARADACGAVQGNFSGWIARRSIATVNVVYIKSPYCTGVNVIRYTPDTVKARVIFVYGGIVYVTKWTSISKINRWFALKGSALPVGLRYQLQFSNTKQYAIFLSGSTAY